MNCVNPIDEQVAPPTVLEVRLPMGLLGFEQIKQYVLIAKPEEEPFRWLQVKENPALAFVVVEPFLVLPGYHPDLPQADVSFLGLSKPEDALVYNIVTLHGAQSATLNLKGPIVFNRHTLIGKQVILANAGDYSVQHPLPLGEAGA